MGMQTDLIRYNVNDRRRVHVGQERHFNVAKLAALINGAKVQEMVKKRDLFGYLGHDIRRRFGLYPPETVLENGEIIPVEPAFVTIEIRIFPDGTVEHRAEFLETPLGKKAQQWHIAQMGGFSSVIAPNEINPTEFWGFDYVLSPNFHGNRGYAVMDNIVEYNRLTSKQKAAIEHARRLEQQAVMDAIFQTAAQQHQQTTSLVKTNQELLATIDSMSQQLEEAEEQRDQLLLQQPKFQAATRLSVSDSWITQSLSVLDDIRKLPLPERTSQHTVLDWIRK